MGFIVLLGSVCLGQSELLLSEFHHTCLADRCYQYTEPLPVWLWLTAELCCHACMDVFWITNTARVNMSAVKSARQRVARASCGLNLLLHFFLNIPPENIDALTFCHPRFERRLRELKCTRRDLTFCSPEDVFRSFQGSTKSISQ